MEFRVGNLEVENTMVVMVVEVVERVQVAEDLEAVVVLVAFLLE
jgi:hypothetical protein